MRRLSLLWLVVLCVAAPALAQETRFYVVKLPESRLTYHLVHPLHEVRGTARPAAGKAGLLADGTLQVVVRANVADFDSGNANRDAHMQEVTEAPKFPLVEFKGVASGVKVPDTFPAKLTLKLKGQLTFHGVKQPVEVPLDVVFTSAKQVSAEGRFPISLEAFKVERPALMLVKVEDAVKLEVKLLLEAEGT